MSERDFEAFWELLLANIILAVNFSLIMSDVITEVLSSLLAGKAINELFTGRINLIIISINCFFNIDR
jgi:hypothetical protein